MGALRRRLGNLRGIPVRLPAAVLAVVLLAACTAPPVPVPLHPAPVASPAGPSAAHPGALLAPGVPGTLPSGSLGVFRRAPLSDLAPNAPQYLAGQPGRFGVAVVVPDREVIYVGGAGDQFFHTASAVKVLIMAMLLRLAQDQGRALSEDETALIEQMIVVSDNDAADILWFEIGGADGVTAFLAANGLSGITPDPEGYWGDTLATPVAVASLVYLLASGQLLDAERTAFALQLMTSVTPEQAWGITSGAVAEGDIVGLKNGWYTDDDGWVVNSAGFVIPPGGGRAYAIAVMSDQLPEMEDGVAGIEGAAIQVHAALEKSG